MTPRPLQHVRVDHCRPYVGMAEKLLDRTDVVSILEQMRGERVPQGVAPGLLVHSTLSHGLLHRPLHRRLLDVVPAADAAPRIDRKTRRGKNILPREFAARTEVLPVECVGEPDLAEAAGQIAQVNTANTLDLRAERVAETLGEHRAAVLRPFSFAHDQ
jgi:hypothetical protein